MEDEWRGHTEGTRQYIKRIIHDPRDWERLPALDPTAPHLAAQLDCLRFIRAELGPDTPLLQTIFSPLAQAKNLAGGETCRRDRSGVSIGRTQRHVHHRLGGEHVAVGELHGIDRGERAQAESGQQFTREEEREGGHFHKHSRGGGD